MVLLDDDRAVSEGTSVAVLVLLTVVVTASVGVGVLVADSESDDEFSAEFAFRHFPEREAMLVTYEEGEEIQASNVVLRGTREVSWATLGDLNESATISPGARVQLNENNAYGDTVTENTNVSVVYVEGDNETVLDTWRGG